jgi:periplasmic protein TonB
VSYKGFPGSSDMNVMARKLTHAITILLMWMPAVWGQSTPKKVSRADAIAAISSRTQPGYPVIAMQLKIEGSVDLEAVVTETGMVEDVVIDSGNPILTKPAAEALKKWKFTPFLEGGKPVKVLAPITIVFKK